jgi:stage III sporulation protein AE
MIKKAFIVLVILACFPAVCLASEDVFDAQYNALKLYKLESSVPASARERNIRVSKNTSLDEGLNGIFRKTKSQVGGILKKGLRCIVAIIAIAALCALAASIGDSENSGTVATCVSAVGAIAVTASAAGGVSGIIGMGSSAISDINAFSKALLPSLAAACAACGAPASAAARYGISIMFVDVVITVISSVMLPLVYAYLAASTADAAFKNVSLAKICDFIKWLVTNSLKILLSVFVVYITVSGIVSSTVDVIGVKTARFAISGAVPVVGGVIADAAETVVAGALVMKNSIGVFGMLVILSICVTPFLTIAVNYLLFKAASCVCAPICGDKLSRLIDNIGAGFGIVLGMTGACAMLMFMSIILSMLMFGG